MGIQSFKYMNYLVPKKASMEPVFGLGEIWIWIEIDHIGMRTFRSRSLYVPHTHIGK